MSQSHDTSQTRLPLAALKGRKLLAFDLPFDAKALAQIAHELELLSLKKLSFRGSIRPAGKEDWALEATLGATAQQPCAITLAPVTTRIDTPVTRRFVAQMPDLSQSDQDDDGEGAPMLEDDSLEELGREIDLMAVLREALALALPDFPRAKGAELGEAIYTAPGVAPMTDQAARPFAGLAALKDQLQEKE